MEIDYASIDTGLQGPQKQCGTDHKKVQDTCTHIHTWFNRDSSRMHKTWNIFIRLEKETLLISLRHLITQWKKTPVGKCPKTYPWKNEPPRVAINMRMWEKRQMKGVGGWIIIIIILICIQQEKDLCMRCKLLCVIYTSEEKQILNVNA